MRFGSSRRRLPPSTKFRKLSQLPISSGTRFNKFPCAQIPRNDFNPPTSRGSARSRTEGRGEPAKLPDPVSAEEASAMNRSEALTKLSEISKARNTAGIDPEAKQKLDESFQHLMQRVRETAP